MAIAYYDYPETIGDAARLLDKVNPGWEKKINVRNLNMSHSQKCILGQLYGLYCDGLRKLFSSDTICSTSSLDNIFGAGAKNESWKDQISARLSATEIKNSKKPVVERVVLAFMQDILKSGFSREVKLHKIESLLAEWSVGTLS